METKTEMQIDTRGTAIVPVEQRELTPVIWRLITQIAASVHKSHIFKGVTSAEAAAIIMLKGHELGLSLTASFDFIQNIQGKFEVIPRGALALALNSPAIKTIKVTRLAENGQFTGYTCYAERHNGFSHESTFLMADARRAGLVKPDSGYEKWPENMCMWRAIGFCLDVVAPDVSSGMTLLMKAPEDYGVELTEGGDVITAEAKDVQPAPPAPYPPGFTLDQLTAQYSVDDILSANDGRIPGTDEEVAAVDAKLSVK